MQLHIYDLTGGMAMQMSPMLLGRQVQGFPRVCLLLGVAEVVVVGEGGAHAPCSYTCIMPARHICLWCDPGISSAVYGPPSVCRQGRMQPVHPFP